MIYQLMNMINCQSNLTLFYTEDPPEQLQHTLFCTLIVHQHKQLYPATIQQKPQLYSAI